MISAPISAREALGRVVEALSGGEVAPGVPGTIKWKRAIAVQERAERLLQTACGSRQLAAFVVDPRNGNRVAMRSDCFERLGSRTIFHRDRFHIWDLDAWTIEAEDYDPLFKTLRDYNGWRIGFEEPKFGTWLETVLGAQNIDSKVVGKALADRDNVEAKKQKAISNRGRQPAPHWAKYEKVMMESLKEDGYPQRGDGGQARLEKFVSNMMATDGIEPLPSESTIRIHVRQCIVRYRDNPLL